MKGKTLITKKEKYRKGRRFAELCIVAMGLPIFKTCVD